MKSWKLRTAAATTRLRAGAAISHDTVGGGHCTCKIPAALTHCNLEVRTEMLSIGVWLQSSGREI